MSTTYSDGTLVSYLEGRGFRVYTGVLPNYECEEVFNSITLELCFFIFGSEARTLIEKFGMDTTKFIADPELRRRQGIVDEIIRRNGNPRDSKVLKKSGKTQLYVSPSIRDKVRRNPRIFDIMATMHSSRTLAFANGIEHIIYKPYKSEESLPILDCKIFEPFGASDSLKNPFHYTCLVCVSNTQPFNSAGKVVPTAATFSRSSGEQTDSSSPSTSSPRSILTDAEAGDDDAALWLLEGFDAHYDDILKIVAPAGPHPISKQKKNIDVSLLENLNVRGINEELRKIHDSKIRADEDLQFGGANTRKRSLTSITSNFKPIRWVKVSMNPGDVLVFDCRIPYKTGRNQSAQPVMYVPVSLRPVNSSWYGTSKHHELVLSITEGKAGNWARRIVKSCNLEEFTWRTHQTDLPGSTLKKVTDISTFNLQDRLIFGLARYNSF